MYGIQDELKGFRCVRVYIELLGYASVGHTVIIHLCEELLLEYVNSKFFLLVSIQDLVAQDGELGEELVHRVSSSRMLVWTLPPYHLL